MIAITVATPDYADMANENAKWMRRNSGLETIVVQVGDKSRREGFETKLSLENIYKGKIVFFDADYRLVADVRGQLQSLNPRNSFLAVHEPSASKGNDYFFSYKDTRELGLPIKKHVNTGFFVCDTSRAPIQRMFARARQVFAEKTNGLWGNITDQTDQTIINLAIHDQRIRVGLMPGQWNWFYYAFREGWCDFPRQVIGLHAAGVYGPAAKRDHLEAGTKFISIPR